MRLRKVLVAGAIAAASITGFAQVTGSGSTNTVPKFSGSSTIGNSAISEVNGNVGIGTATPATALDVSPSLTNPSANIPSLPGGSVATTGLINVAPNLTFSDNANRSVVGAQFMPSILSSSTSGNPSVVAVRGSAYRTNLNDLSTMGALVGGVFGAGHVDTTSTATPTTTTVYGTQSGAYNYSGTISNSYGLWAQSYNTSANATTTNGYGVFSQIRSNNSNVGTGYGLYTTTNISGSGTIGTYYGLYLADPSTTGITNRYGIYQANNLNRNYFAGNVGIGTSSPTALLSVGSTSQFQVNSSGAISTSGGLSVGGNQVINSSGVWVGPSSGLVGPQGPAGPAGATGPAGASPWVLSGSNTYYTSGNVGIGTTSPGSPLDVSGIIHVSGSTNPSTTAQGAYLGWNALTGGTGETDFINNQGGGPGGFAFMNTPSSGSPRTTLMFLAGSGNVGVGTTSPAMKLDVAGKIHADGMVAGNQQTLIGYSGISPFGGLNSGQPIFLSNGGDGGNNQFFYNMYQNYESLMFGAVNFGSSPYGGVNGASFSNLFQIRGDGAIFTGRPQNVPNSSNSNAGLVVSNMLDNGAGDMAVSRNLGVAGNVALTGGGAHMTYPDGTVQATAWNGTTCGGDYAESVDVTGDRKRYEAGDVLVIDADSPDKFLHSSEPYSRFVAGIYSTRPGLTGRREGRGKTGEEVPMAMLGIVPTKVSAENGAIRPGDLLVSSATEGYAMKGTDSTRMMGAVIGKAMGRLEKGTGTIEVLVSLQ